MKKNLSILVGVCCGTLLLCAQIKEEYVGCLNASSSGKQNLISSLQDDSLVISNDFSPKADRLYLAEPTDNKELDRFLLRGSSSAESFPVKNAQWTVCCNSSCFDGYGFWDDHHLTDYRFSLAECDTIWNQKTYHIFTESYLRGGFRMEDAKVWITFDWIHEYLLYDFDVNVGDTIYHGAIYKEIPSYQLSCPAEGRREQPAMSVVDRTENELGKKKIYVQSFLWNTFSLVPDWEYWGYDVWQEEIGSLYGLFMSWNRMGPLLTGGYCQTSYHTLMLHRDGRIVYFDPVTPWHSEQPDIRGLNEVNSLGLQVFYEESTKNLSVRSEDKYWSGTLHLYDLSGKWIAQFSVFGGAQIPLEAYSGGYYLCEIVCNKQIVYTSKIKI